jgi:large subunit ribosomal protein L4
MISIPIRNSSGQDVGTYEFDPGELAATVNKQLLHDVVVMHLANQRLGTVRTKSRSMVAGSTKKLFRQKGTGRARCGPKRTPIRRGGGHAFAKIPKDWGYRLPRKSIQLATRMALLSKFLDDEVTVLDELSVDQPRTKVVADMLKALGVAQDSCLLTIESHDPNVWKSSRNIANLEVSPAANLNAYTLLRQKRLVVTKGALDRLRGQGVAAPSADAGE